MIRRVTMRVMFMMVLIMMRGRKMWNYVANNITIQYDPALFNLVHS